MRFMDPRWIKLKDAARYSAIGRHRLMRLASNGKIVGFKDPGNGRADWVFDRDSLDAYRLSQYSLPEIEKRANEILASLS